jgi:hypothetical protein
MHVLSVDMRFKTEAFSIEKSAVQYKKYIQNFKGFH